METEISYLRNRFIDCGAGRVDRDAVPEISSRGPSDCNPDPIQTVAASDDPTRDDQLAKTKAASIPGRR